MKNRKQRSQIDRAASARDQRRKELLEAATRVFARKGYWNASITDIIETAGVARGTFYLYFQGKQEIFAAIVDKFREEEMQLMQQPIQHAGSQIGKDWRERTNAAVRSWFEFFCRNLDAAKLVIRDANMIDPSAAGKREGVRRAVRSLIAENISRMQDAGIYDRKVSAEMAAHFLQAMFEATALSYLQNATKHDLEKLTEQFVELMLHGMSAR